MLAVSVTESNCDLTSCLFEFFPVWAALGVTSGSAFGATSVPIQGFGFALDLSTLYTCQWTAVGNAQDSAPTLALNASTILCQTPAWNSRAGLATVSVRNISRISGAGGADAYAFLSSWVVKNVSEVPAVGGQGLRVTGVGFDVSSAYVCVFTAGAHVRDSAAAALDGNTIECRIPRWPWEAQSTAFSIEIVGSTEAVVFAGLDASETSLRFTAGFFGLASHSATGGASTGGDLVVLDGYGFGEGYNCTFSRGTQVAESKSIIEDAFRLACLSPAWGRDFGAAVTAVGVASAGGDALPLTDESLSELNATNCWLGPGLPRCAYAFATVWSNALTAPTAFAAAGGEAMTLQGFGFVPELAYTCAFARGAYTVSAAASTLSPRELRCASPVWHNPAAADAVLDVLLSGQSLLRASPSFQQLFNILPVVTAIVPVRGAATGGDTILVAGNGFNPSLPYLCELQGVAFGASYVSDIELQCTVPVRTWSFGESSIAVLENALYMDAANLTFDFGALATSVSQDFGNRLGGVGTTSTDAWNVVVSGAGFFATFSFACSFTLVSPKVLTPATLVSAGALQTNLAIMREILDTVHADNCPCPGGCRSLEHGIITDGFGRYPRDISCYWFLAPRHASSLAVSFSDFNTESNFDVVSVWACDDDRNCSNPTLLNLLSGSGPAALSHIVSPTGVVLITFRSDGLLDGAGFTARFQPAAAQSLFQPPASGDQFTCTLPVWDASTPWNLYALTVTELRVLSSQDGGLTSSVVPPASGASNSVVSNFTFLQINQPPSFGGTNVHVAASLTDKPVSINQWAGVVLVGTDDFNEEIPVESESQQVTFTVAVSQGQDLFRSPPSIAADGTLSFTVAAQKYGVATLRVTLFDDGETADGGVDVLFKTFQVEVFTEPPFQDTPQLSAVFRIEVAEGSGPHRIVDAITDIAPGVIDTLLKTVNVSVSSGFAYFSLAPYVQEQGTLFFQVQPFVFGNATITVTVVAIDPNSNATSTSTATIHVTILPVNDQPWFQISSSSVVVPVDESKGGAARHSLPGFVTAIATGPPGVAPGPDGEDWPELLQTVTFVVTGAGRPFQVQPTIAANGTLSFVLTADIAGLTRFSIQMQDSGGEELGGIAWSETVRLDVLVRQVNDRPSFDINCRPALANAQSYSCGAGCSSSSAGCSVSINVDENCANCQESALAPCAYGFVVENFALKILTSAIGSPDEDWQSLSFIVSASPDSLALLETLPTIDADTGTLRLCLKESANGNATFEVRLQDDGGTYAGALDTSEPAEIALQIFSVNQQPSMEVCSDCIGACCDEVGQCCGPNVVVWDASGLHSIPGVVNAIHRGWVDSDGNDPESSQSVSLTVVTVVPVNVKSDLFVRHPTLHVNGTLEFELQRNVSGSFAFTISVEDDGYFDDVASGTVARNAEQGTAYAGVSVSASVTVSVVVSNSFVLVCYNASLSAIHSNAPAAEMRSIWNSSLLSARLSVAAGLNLDVGRVLLDPFPGGICLKILGESVSQSLVIAQQGQDITQLVQMGIQNATTARRSLLKFAADVEISFVSATAYLRDRDSVAVFDVVNASYASYPFSNPFVLPKICGYAHPAAQPFVFDGFVGNIVAPPNSPIDEQGSPMAFFDILPVRHRLRESMQWTVDGTDGGLFTVGPLLVSNCPSSCANATQAHVGCQWLDPCRKGALIAVQNPLVHGEAEYEITLRGSNVSAFFRVLIHRSLAFKTLLSVLVRNESLVDLDVSYPDFFFVTSVPGDVGSFHLVNFSVECLDCGQLPHQGFSVFAAPPSIVVSADNGGDLRFTQRAGMYGNVTLRATMSIEHPDACKVDRLTLNVSARILPVKNAPFFRVNCSVDPAQVECLQPCDEPANNCSAVVSVEEDCRYCARDFPLTCANPFSLKLFIDPTSLAPSRQQYLAEASQNMTFMVSPIGNASLLFSQLPAIDAETGSLSFCLRSGIHGNMTFAVWLVDGGGDERAGVDMSGVALLTIVVYRVNDQASIDVCSSCDGACCSDLAVCCGQNIAVWESSGRHQLQIIDAVRAGRESLKLPAVFDEAYQRTTFLVEIPHGTSSLFVRPPYIDGNGTLDFEFRSNVSGLFVLDVYVEDDGLGDDVAAGTVLHNQAQGAAYAGLNRSRAVPLTLVVSNSYMLVEFKAGFNASAVNPTAWNSTLNGTHPAVLGASLLASRAAVSAGLGINVGRVLVFQRKAAGFVLQVIGSSVVETVAHVRNAANISSWVQAGALPYNITLVSAVGYVKDLDHIPSYNATNTTVTSFAMEYPLDDPWILDSFLTNIVAPPDSPIDDEGRRIVSFQITPKIHRNVVTSPWIADGTDGALSSLLPHLTATCEIVGDRLCSANLSLWKDALSHGQAVYEVKMLNTHLDLVANFTLTFWFSFVRAVQAHENQENIMYSQFVRSMIDPNVPYNPLTKFDFVSTGALADQNAVFEKKTTSDHRFRVRIAESASFPVLGLPVVELLGNGFGEMSLDLIQFGNGNATFKLAFAPDSTEQGQGDFTVEVLPVNQPPLFQTPQPQVTVVQHQYSAVPYLASDFATDIATGPVGSQWDEGSQSLTFRVLGLDGDQTRTTQDNSTYPIFAASGWPQVHPNGTCSFTLRDDWFGLEAFRLVLEDDGGTERGGRASSFLDFEIQVLHTNHPPTFTLASNTISVLENSGAFVGNGFAMNISTGAVSGPELEQLLTFSLVQSFCALTVDAIEHPPFALDPILHANGTIAFTPAADMFASCTYDVFLFDDGGTERNGVNFSVASLQITVENINSAPLFALVEDVVVVDEGQHGPGRVRVIADFASHITAGPPSEGDQDLTFRVTAIETVLPYDAPLGPLDETSAYLFDPGSQVQVHPNGTLRFVPAPFRNGKVTFVLFLADDGGTRFNGSNTSSLNFTIEVLPVNSQPNFTLPTSLISVNEGASGCTADPFMLDVQPGSWAEEHQDLTFEFSQTSGPYGVVASMSAECAGTAPMACSICYELTEDRFGNMSFNVTMRDSGGTEREGVDARTVEIFMHVMPRNSIPRFRLAQDAISLDMGSGAFTESFAYMVSLGKWEDSLVEGCDVSAFCAGGNCATCEAQTGRFALNKTDEQASAPHLFEVEPSLSYPDGVLSFTLNDNVVGIAWFDVLLVDSGALDNTVRASEVRRLQIISRPVLTFRLCSPQLEVFEGSGAVSKQVAAETRVESTAFSNLPSLFYSISVDNPHLFAEAPSLSPEGVLTFVVLEEFGRASITVWLRDDGGTINGRRDQSDPQSLILKILPVNDQPGFEISPFVSVSESSGVLEFPHFASRISPGPLNEGCESEMHACQTQNVSFVVVAIDGMSVFRSLPRITSDGTLELDLAPGVSGAARVSVLLEDDGYSTGMSSNQSDACGASLEVQFADAFGRNKSAIQSFVVSVQAANTPPGFAFPFSVRCDLSQLTPGCSCDPFIVEGAECVPASEDRPALIETRESVGLKHVHNFAMFSSPARDFFPRSMATYAYEGDLRFTEVRGDPIALNHGFEYSVDYVLSPDKKFAFAAEYETDSIAVFAIESEGTEVTATFLDRRTEEQNRLLVSGFGDAAPNQREPRRVESNLVCDWEAFKVGEHHLVGAASGCEDLEAVVEASKADAHCGPGGLGASCGYACCHAIWNATRGLWDMKTAAMAGASVVNSFSGQQQVSCTDEQCTYSRPRFASCGEHFATHVAPATIADKAGGLGAAVMTGPNCKNFFNQDWDGPSTSLESFMINDGTHEAMAFDGILHTGLYVTDDIRDISSKFPTRAMSAEAVFTIEADAVDYGGLVAVQQDGGGCRRGWSLAYDVEASPFGSLVTFYYSVATADAAGTSEGKMTVVTHSETIQIGRWYHMVGAYNGSHAHLYIDGEQRSVEPACGSLDCGPVIYAESYEHLGTCVVFGSQVGTPFTIGTYENRMNGGRFPHVGSIKSIRVLDIALSPSQIAALHSASVAGLIHSPTLQQEFWVRGVGDNPGLGLSGLNSPSSDFADARKPHAVSLVGNFSLCREYSISFTYTDPWGANVSVESEPGALACTLPTCGELSANMLTCQLPEWAHGFKATVMSVSSSPARHGAFTTPSAPAETPTPNGTVAPTCPGESAVAKGIAARERGVLWQRVCLAQSCGFTSFGERAGGQTYWYLYGGSYALHPQLKGTLARFRFVDPSAVYVFDSPRERLLPLLPFEIAPCASGSCQWDKTTCQGGPSQGIGCSDDDECGSGFECISADPKRVMGSRSFTHISSGARHFLLVARAWDGLTARLASPVFEMVVFETPAPNVSVRTMSNCSLDNCTSTSLNGTDAAGPAVEAKVSFLQDVPALGAGNWEHSILPDGGEFVAVSELLGPSSLYAWDPASGTPVDLNSRIAFHDQGASSIQVFSLANRTYLAAATFQRGMPSAIYEIESRGAFRVLSLTHVQDVETPGGAHDVLHMHFGAVHLLAFAATSPSTPSRVYTCSDAGLGPLPMRCELLQTLDTTRARSLQTFSTVTNSDYLLIAQEIGSKLLRWNGVVFLGKISADTQPSDTAAGLDLPDISRTFEHFGPDVNGTVRDYFLAGKYVQEGGNGGFLVESYLWKGLREEVANMDGPVSLQISPLHGRFLYVASELSQAITIFSRHNGSGSIQYIEDHVSVRGLQRIAISNDGRNLYASAYLPGEVVVFSIDDATGFLKEMQRISNSGDWESGPGFIEGLAGASGLCVSENGASVYVAGYLDNAVVAFNRNASGHLAYADRLVNGERSIASFHDVVNAPRARSGVDHDAGGRLFPRHLSTSSDGAPLPARSSISFKIGGVLYLAVAFSDAEGGPSDGGVVVYEWSEVSMAFDTLQRTARDTSAACVQHTVIDGQHYLLVGNSYRGSGGGSGISIYLWVDGAFELQHTVGEDRSVFPRGLYPSAMQVFTVGGVRLVAVSCYRDEASAKTQSYVLQARMIRGSAAAPALRLDLLQTFNTLGASDVVFAETNNDRDAFLLWANFFGEEGPRDSTVDVYHLDPDTRIFSWSQTIPARGCADLEAFSLPDVGDVLAVSNRQVELATTVGDLPNYDTESEIYVLDAPTRTWVLFQSLDDGIHSLMAASGFDRPSGTYEGVYSQYFCRPFCVENESAQGITLSLPRLRGVTSMTAFHVDGETYLAVSQSTCDAVVGVARCAQTMPQPQSAVLQFNKQDRRFSELLAGKWTGGKAQLKRLERALRLDAGRASSFQFVEAGAIKMLVSLSLSSGITLYEWDFSSVTGLAGVSSVTSDADDARVLLVSRGDRAVVVVRRELYVDDLGRPPSTCSDTRCLHIAHVLSETPKRISRNVAAELIPNQGLGSASKIRFWEGEACEPGSKCTVAVTGRQPRDELQCLDFPPSRPAMESIHVDAVCQDVEFQVAWVDGDHPDDLFDVMPSLSPNGTLTFKPRFAQNGVANFAALVIDSAGGRSSTKMFTVAVLEVNQAPLFTAVDAVANAGQGFQDVAFAVDVSAGQDEDQALAWSFSYTSAISIGDQVSMSVIDTAAGKIGELRVSPPAGISGTALFSVSLSDLGPSDVARGDVNRSLPQTFTLNVRRVNLPPVLAHPSAITLLENGGAETWPGFLSILSLGSDEEAEQKVTLSVDIVQPAGGFFQRLAIHRNGTLEFELERDRNGVMEVTLRVQDDGDTAFAGVDTAFAIFSVTVLPRNSPPAFIASTHLTAVSSVYQDSVVVAKDFLVLLPPPADEAEQNVTVSVESVSNAAVFSTLPALDADGTLTFSLSPEMVGETVIAFLLQDDGGIDLGGQNEARFQTRLEIVAGLRDLDFNIPPILDYVEGAGAASISLFVTENGLEPRESFHAISFSVTVRITNTRLFVSLPLISPAGVLTFTAQAAEFGQAELTVTAHFDRSLLNDKIAGRLQLPASTLRILPRPRVVSITPNVGSALGGARVTIVGEHMGSQATRDNVTVSIGGRRCASLTWISRAQLSCAAPPGLGPADVVVAVGQGLSSRSATLPGAFTHAVLYYGGSVSVRVGGGRGFLAASPSSSAIDTSIAASLLRAALQLSTSVNAIEAWRGQLIVASSYEPETVGLSDGVGDGAARADNILAWDGHTATPLANGLNGPVSALADYNGLLVVGGSFTAAHQDGGRGSLKTGGLVAWDGDGWVRVGGTTLQGSVSAMLVDGQRLYVAGAFQRLGAALCEGFAVFDGAAWSCPWGSVHGGTVQSIVLWRESLVIGGSFATVGGVRAGKLARWEQGHWIAMGEAIDGIVHCLAHQQDRLYVGGEFSLAVDDRNPVNLAYISSANLLPVGDGLDRGVYALAVAHNCLYVGGAFVHYAARYCATGGSLHAVMEPITMSDVAPLPGPIRVIAHAVGRERGEQSTEGVTFVSSEYEKLVKDEL